MSDPIDKHFEILNNPKEYEINYDIPMSEGIENSLRNVGNWLELLFRNELEPVSEEQEKFVEVGNVIKYFISINSDLSRILRLLDTFELNEICVTFLRLKILELTFTHKENLGQLKDLSHEESTLEGKSTKGKTSKSKQVWSKPPIGKFISKNEHSYPKNPPTTKKIKRKKPSKKKSTKKQIKYLPDGSPICTYCGNGYPIGRKKLGYNYCVNCSSETKKSFKENSFYTRDDVKKLKKMMFSNMKKNHRE